MVLSILYRCVLNPSSTSLAGTIPTVQKRKGGAGEISPWFRVYTALAKDPNLFSSAHIGWLTTVVFYKTWHDNARESTLSALPRCPLEQSDLVYKEFIGGREPGSRTGTWKGVEAEGRGQRGRK